jgi:hypothetical protein
MGLIDSPAPAPLVEEMVCDGTSGHPVIASAEVGERWLYCYPDDDSLEY